MARTVTYTVGLEGFDEYKADVEGTEQEITVEVQDLDADPWSVGDKHRLIGKDIPFLNIVIPLEFSAVLVKGRRNYLSLRRLDNAMERGALGVLRKPIDFVKLRGLLDSIAANDC